MAEQPTTPRNSKKFAAPNTTQNTTPGGGTMFSAPSERAPMTNGPRGSGAFSAPSERNPWQSEKGFSAPTQPNQLKYGRQPQDPWANRQQNEQREPLQFEAQTVQEDPRYERSTYEEQPRPYEEQPYYAGYEDNSQYGGYEPPKKKSNALIYVIIALAAALVLAAGAIIFITQKDKCASDSDGGETETASQAEQQSSYTEPQDEPQDEPQSGNTEPQDEPQSGYTEQQTQEAFYPVKKNGKSVTSASELSMYDVVTFGNYPQTSLGVEKPIQWYVVGKEGNKVTLLSVYALDSKKFHNKNEEVTFLGSDIFKWLNDDFKYRAFNDEETAVMASPVSLMGKEDAMRLPLTYRKTTSTDYAISQGADAKRCLWWVGDFSKTYEFVEYYGWWWYDTSLASAAYCVHDDGQLWEYQVNFSGKAVRPMVIVQF
jgi:hypothetical protein